ncbi:hypothetical protein SKAU_G00289610 [Synaphobranchus kaupii]|uniref:Uncharacterized protein n=1 Tax=Synaphobranchus kaupii TaxID=118154 RepID=A0A9Q1ETK2_SYNKA|nr:hypothetical protein SKAU_G00289610 [Synaphobranchus kaupii]
MVKVRTREMVQGYCRGKRRRELRVRAARVKKRMVGLRGLDGKIQTGAVEMVGVATEFYRGLFENRVVEEGVGKRFLGLVEERVPEEVRAALEAPFNLEELRQALGGMKGGKVPGCDSLPK